MPPLRVVLDTNVLVSGLLTPAGAPGWIVDLALDGTLLPAIDARILDEYREVLLRPRLRLPAPAVATLLSAIIGFGLNVSALPWPHPLPDPDDEPFLAVAGAAGALLITGNLRHFPVASRGSVQVLSPRQCLDLLRERVR